MLLLLNFFFSFFEETRNFTCWNGIPLAKDRFAHTTIHIITNFLSLFFCLAYTSKHHGAFLRHIKMEMYPTIEMDPVRCTLHIIGRFVTLHEEKYTEQ